MEEKKEKTEVVLKQQEKKVTKIYKAKDVEDYSTLNDGDIVIDAVEA